MLHTVFEIDQKSYFYQKMKNGTKQMRFIKTQRSYFEQYTVFVSSSDTTLDIKEIQLQTSHLAKSA